MDVDQRLLSPVRRIDTDPDEDSPGPGIGLCQSGGGYRAMLYHAGGLWRLNQAGWLPKLSRVSSVSGGSIIAGVLATRWHRLEFDLATGVAAAFESELIGGVRAMADRTIDIPAGIEGLVHLHDSINDRLVDHYRDALFGDATLQDLPDVPDFVFNATSLQTGDLWRFSKREQGDWRVGSAAKPTTPVAVVVAASSAFPPVLSPCRPKLAEGPLTGGADPLVAVVPYIERPVLADGGVYDNLGLETVWKQYKTVLISDGGAAMPDAPDPPALWPEQFVRVLNVIDNQVRALRKRQAVSSFILGARDGAYWGIGSDVADFGLADPILVPAPGQVKRLAGVHTRLAHLDAAIQEQLINWGYLICDTAFRRHVEPGAPKGALPYPDAGLG